jgi:hypothetical protein
VGLLALGACKKDLVVQNQTQPDQKRVLATPRDVEATMGSYYLRWHSGMYGTLSNVWGMASVMSFEDFSTLSNNCMGQRVGIPRAGNDNSVGNGCAAEQQRIYQVENEVQRVASSLLAQASDPNFQLGSQAQILRLQSFGQFLRGVALGYLAMVYDSSAVITPQTDVLDPGKLEGYPDVMTAALDALKQAEDLATQSQATPGSGGFPLPPSWIPSSTTMTGPEFIKLIHSYAARFRANVARTPAERAAVDWNAVIADAQAGITADHDNITNTTTGPNNVWLAQFYAYTTWHQMTPFVIGMADTSGAYAAWIAKSLSDRGNDGPFFMVTPDQRFPQGDTRTAQQTDFALTQCSAASTPCKRYFVNRPSGNDVNTGSTWGLSNYDHARFFSWRTKGDLTGQNGKLIFFTKAELDMLQAEGLIRTGKFADAAALINKTRVANGKLPAITAFDANSPVPGGNACVPKVPVGPSFNTLACGNMMEAMKYEKRIEEAYTHFAAWYLDERGWGDLAQGTPLDWAVPYQDLLSRGYASSAVYSKGGSASPGAAKGTYGW